MTMYEAWCVESNKAGPVLPVPPPILAQECSSEFTAHRPELVPAVRRTPNNAKIDAEFDRFARVAKPTPSGQGWHDPAESPEILSGVSGESWDAFVRDCSNLSKRGKS